MVKLSVIIPCFNEEENLRRGVLKDVDDYLNKRGYLYEVIICNDQSTDQSLSLAQKFVKNHSNFQLLNLPKSGKPGALWKGIQQAKFPYVLFSDMDQSTPIEELSKFLPYFSEGVDIIIGSRGQSREGNSLLRKLGSKTFSLLRNAFLHTHIVDTQCGFKAMKTDLAKSIFPRLEVIKNIQDSGGWRVTAYDVELLFIAQKMGCSIKEIEVDWKNEDVSTTKGNANARYLKESKQMAQEVGRVLLNYYKGYYDFKK